MIDTKLNRDEFQAGSGIVKLSARPIRFLTDDDGEVWICDAGVDPTNKDFRSQGCTPHSEVHLVK